MNPVSPAALDAAVEALGLRRGGRVVELGCGKGGLLLRIAARYPIDGLGLDRDPVLLAEARAEAERRALRGSARFVEADVLSWRGDAGAFDLACSVGATFDGYRETLARLRDLAAPRGLVLFGDCYWRRQPTPSYLEALGAAADELADQAGLVAAAARLGLALVHAATSSVEDFDRYEDAWAENGERYAAVHPGEPGVDDFLAWIGSGRRRHRELGGRETLGFGLFLFRRGVPAPS
jgi:cyclopropane fatty-acyl-phospholipid synthase-like methyltransferase